jgi:large subunit ribosomal protein L16
MFLAPKKPKFTKSFSGKKTIPKNSKKNFTFLFSNYCLLARESGIITNFQIESIRRFLRRFLKKKGQIFFRVFPNIPTTKKPNEIRLGRGKGKFKY